MFGTGATQRVRITSAGTPAGLNTGGSSGGTPGNPTNNNYLHVTGSLFPNSLFNGGPEEFRPSASSSTGLAPHSLRASPTVTGRSDRLQPHRFSPRRCHDRRRGGRTGAVQHHWPRQCLGLLMDPDRSGGCVPELHHLSRSRADNGTGPRGRDIGAGQTGPPAIPSGDSGHDRPWLTKARFGRYLG